jgi:8-amino-7-oxononanoate synthase
VWIFIPIVNSFMHGPPSQLADRLFELSSYFVNTLADLIKSRSISSAMISLSPYQYGYNADQPSHIIPILTPHPFPLSAHLIALGLNVRAIMFPTVPKGKERLRICLHAGNTKEEVDRLISGIVTWAEKRISDCSKL